MLQSRFADNVTRFMFEGAAVRGALVSLDDACGEIDEIDGRELRLTQGQALHVEQLVGEFAEPVFESGLRCTFAFRVKPRASSC